MAAGERVGSLRFACHKQQGDLRAQHAREPAAHSDVAFTGLSGSRADQHPFELVSLTLRDQHRNVCMLEHADIPVLVAKGDRQTLKRVLICTAAGEPGKSDVRVGGRLARMLGAEVTLLFVTRESEGPDSLTRSHLDRASATLRAQDVASQVRVRFADTPLAGILEEAKDGDHDLIVIGSHGPRSRSLFALNDVTLQVLSTADRSVLVVPTNSM